MKLKPPLLLLHGAIGASAQFDQFAFMLEQHFEAVHRVDFEGHGDAPLRDRPFRMAHFAENVRDYLAMHTISSINIFGYSMGGYVAVLLARTQPTLVKRIATLGTKYLWEAEGAAREVRLLDPEKIKAKVPAFARTLEARHTAGWETVLAKTREMLTALGESPALTLPDFAAVQHRVRIMIGDKDTTAGIEDSLRVYRALPNAEFEVLPDSPHPLEQVQPYRITRSLIEFFAE
jgi:pimeloyl-ACP methyl ester carboxylesterase